MTSAVAECRDPSSNPMQGGTISFSLLLFAINNPASNVPLGQRCIMVSMVAVCMLLLGQRCIMVGVFTVWMSPLAQR